MEQPVKPGIVFDVDDTLYLEVDYVRSGFRAVSVLAAGRGTASADDVYEFLWGCFERGVRSNTFDLLLKEVPGLAGRLGVHEMVDAYRTHEPEIRLLPGAAELLSGLRARGVRLGLITDGALQSQQRKFDALGLDRYVELAVLTDRWGRECWKPHPRAFEHFSAEWDIPAQRMAYVGDNPDKDFVAPNRLGWWTVRLRMQGQLRAMRESTEPGQGAQLTVASIGELTRSLENWI